MTGRLVPCAVSGGVKWRDFLAHFRSLGHSKAEAREAWDSVQAELANAKNYANDTYHVVLREGVAHGLGNDFEIAELSIKRHDRAPVCDWRDVQDIKNQLCGLEAEAVMLYPAQSRVVDTANQYWLYVVTKPAGFLFPFGMFAGYQTDKPLGNSKQRPLSGKG